PQEKRRRWRDHGVPCLVAPELRTPPWSSLRRDAPRLVVGPIATGCPELREDRRVDETDRAPVGVGPWPGGRAAWPDGPRLDPELLERGDARNAVYRYRYWRLEAIVADLDTRRHPFHVAIENRQHDLNIGSIVRSANASGAEAVHIVGHRRWNRRG